MTNINYTPERIKGKHLTFEEKEEILHYKEKGYSMRHIAKIIGVITQTIINEINRGTVKQAKTVAGKVKHYSKYSPIYSQYIYVRKNNKNASKLNKCVNFINYLIKMIKKYNASIDEVIGRAKLLNLYNKYEMVCKKTVYNYVDSGLIDLINLDLPEKVKRKKNYVKRDTRKTILGKSILERPEVVEKREEFGHFEADTVVGKKGKENVLLVLTERKTRYQINIMIDSKTTDSVEYGMKKILNKYGKHIFKTITVDNGKEFTTLSDYLKSVCSVYYCRPYTASDRATNENQNKIIRKFIPKGFSLDLITRSIVEDITSYINNKERKILGYRTAKELFEKELELIKN